MPQPLLRQINRQLGIFLVLCLPLVLLAQTKNCGIDFRSLKNAKSNEQLLQTLDSIKNNCLLEGVDKLKWLHLRGKVCVDMARYDEALDHFQMGMNQFHTNSSDTFSAIFSNQIGVVKYYLGQKEEAIRWFIKANDIASNHNMTKLVAFCSNNVGALYNELGIYDSAEVYLFAALEAFDKMGSKNEGAYLLTYRILATNYESMGQIEKSNSMYRKMVALARKNQDDGALANVMLVLANQEARLGQRDSALVHVELGRQLYEKDSTQIDNIATANEYVASVNAQLGNYENAYEALSYAGSMRQKVFSTSLSSRIGEMEVEFNTESERQKRALAESKAKSAKQRMVLIIVLFFFVIIAFLGVFLVYQQRQKRKLVEKDIQVQKGRIAALLEGEERERTRIARDLHDGVSQLLGALKMNLSAAGVDDFQSISLLDQGINEVRTISHNLLPKQLGKGGIGVALNQMMFQIENNNGLSAQFVDHTNDVELSLELQQNIFRIAQETVNNALKHAKATQITCELSTYSDTISLHIIDNGTGLSESDIENASGIGWKNIMARLELLQGTLKLKPSSKGTHLIFTFPFQSTTTST